jgi:hypothetical protein
VRNVLETNDEVEHIKLYLEAVAVEEWNCLDAVPLRLDAGVGPLRPESHVLKERRVFQKLRVTSACKYLSPIDESPRTSYAPAFLSDFDKALPGKTELKGWKE